tara:strand:- start:292 stop:639 length:348 start_codon:yes stop_codon:yes gene_type:complete
LEGIVINYETAVNNLAKRWLKIGNDGELFDFVSEALDFMVLLGFDVLCVLRYTKSPDAVFDVGTDQFRGSVEGTESAGEVLWTLATWSLYYDVLNDVEKIRRDQRQLKLIPEEHP